MFSRKEHTWVACIMTPRQLGPLTSSRPNRVPTSRPHLNPRHPPEAQPARASSRGFSGPPVVMLKSNRLASCAHCSSHSPPRPHRSTRPVPLHHVCLCAKPCESGLWPPASSPSLSPGAQREPHEPAVLVADVPLDPGSSCVRSQGFGLKTESQHFPESNCSFMIAGG